VKPRTRRKTEKRKWTENEINILKSLYESKTNTYIANLLNRSVASIRSMKSFMGLTKQRYKPEKIKNVFVLNPNPITDITEVIVCGSVVRGENLNQLSLDIGRTIEQIEEILSKCKQNGKYAEIKSYIKNE